MLYTQIPHPTKRTIYETNKAENITPSEKARCVHCSPMTQCSQCCDMDGVMRKIQTDGSNREQKAREH